MYVALSVNMEWECSLWFCQLPIIFVTGSYDWGRDEKDLRSLNHACFSTNDEIAKFLDQWKGSSPIPKVLLNDNNTWLKRSLEQRGWEVIYYKSSSMPDLRQSITASVAAIIANDELNRNDLVVFHNDFPHVRSPLNMECECSL